jgi:hypothetical protein
MQRILIFLLVKFTILAALNSQTQMPFALQGTWKVPGKQIYENWDILNTKQMMGFSYRMHHGQMLVSEYLHIEKRDNDIIYSASVKNQNEGKAVDFLMSRADSVLVFENDMHDFPKRITYNMVSENIMHVILDDGGDKRYAYALEKMNLDLEKLTEKDYDAELASQYGADDYGMKTYFLVILKTGHSDLKDKDAIAQSFRGHMGNIQKLSKERKLLIAGPLGQNPQNYRGIFVFQNVGGMDELKGMLMDDPAIENGLLDYDVYDWYGSAALEAYLPVAEVITKIKP